MNNVGPASHCEATAAAAAAAVAAAAAATFLSLQQTVEAMSSLLKRTSGHTDSLSPKTWRASSGPMQIGGSA
jgi:hypothetical protein